MALFSAKRVKSKKDDDIIPLPESGDVNTKNATDKTDSSNLNFNHDLDDSDFDLPPLPDDDTMSDDFSNIKRGDVVIPDLKETDDVNQILDEKQKNPNDNKNNVNKLDNELNADSEDHDDIAEKLNSYANEILNTPLKDDVAAKTDNVNLDENAGFLFEDSDDHDGTTANDDSEINSYVDNLVQKSSASKREIKVIEKKLTKAEKDKIKKITKENAELKNEVKHLKSDKQKLEKKLKENERKIEKLVIKLNSVEDTFKTFNKQVAERLKVIENEFSKYADFDTVKELKDLVANLCIEVRDVILFDEKLRKDYEANKTKNASELKSVNDKISDIVAMMRAFEKNLKKLDDRVYVLREKVGYIKGNKANVLLSENKNSSIKKSAKKSKKKAAKTVKSKSTKHTSKKSKK